MRYKDTQMPPTHEEGLTKSDRYMRIEKKRNEEKVKTHDRDKGKSPESSHYVVAHCNIGVTEDLFNVSLTSWRISC